MRTLRLLLLAALALLLSTVAHPTPAVAARLRPTTIDTYAVHRGASIADCGTGPQCYWWDLHAELTDERGAPLAGRPIEFRLDTGEVVCTRTTGPTGFAICTISSVQAGTIYRTSKAYTASFAGDRQHAPASSGSPWNSFLY